MCVELWLHVENVLSAMGLSLLRRARGKRTVWQRTGRPGADDERPVDEGICPQERPSCPTREEAEAGEIELGHK